MFGKIIVWIALVYLVAYALLGKDSHDESRVGVIVAGVAAWLSIWFLM